MIAILQGFFLIAGPLCLLLNSALCVEKKKKERDTYPPRINDERECGLLYILFKWCMWPCKFVWGCRCFFKALRRTECDPVLQSVKWICRHAFPSFQTANCVKCIVMCRVFSICVKHLLQIVAPFFFFFLRSTRLNNLVLLLRQYIFYQTRSVKQSLDGCLTSLISKWDTQTK